MTTENRTSFWMRCVGSTPEDRRNQLHLLRVTLGWALVLVACSYLIKREMVTSTAALWVVALLPTLGFLFVIAAWVRFLSGADEFQRALQLRALGIGFAGSALIATCYPLLVRVGAPELSLSDFGALMAFLYVGGALLSALRYR